MSSSTGYQAMPGWYWPDDPPRTGTEPASDPQPSSAPTGSETNSRPQTEQSSRPRRRYWPPRQCRICLETVQPIYHAPSESLPEFLQGTPNVTYESPEGGRLLCPCKCKGSSKYVHEECLQAWRHSDNSYGRRTYWQCPTCGFRYRLARLGWGRVVASVAAQIILTIAILFVVVFVLGFVADPIINLYLDPWGYLGVSSRLPDYYYEDDEASTWTEHFLKGLTSMGVIGFLKVVFASPFSYFRVGGRRGRATGRDRYEQVSWLIILIGVATFLTAIYKGVRAWSLKALEKAGERIIDVQNDDDDEDDQEQEPAPPET